MKAISKQQFWDCCVHKIACTPVHIYCLAEFNFYASHVRFFLLNFSSETARRAILMEADEGCTMCTIVCFCFSTFVVALIFTHSQTFKRVVGC